MNTYWSPLLVALGNFVLQEVFNLEEGPVTLMFPGNMSEDSYQDLEDRLKIVLRGLKRRTQAPRAAGEATAGYKIDLGDK